MINAAGKKVLIRVDFNVPLDAQFHITDDNRIQAAVPTIKKVLADGGAAILMSHLGRPRKKDGTLDLDCTLRHIVPHLSEVLGVPVQFCPEPVGPQATKMAADLKMGEVLLLENTRFLPGEEKGSEELAQALAALGDAYINDAFGTAHRAHASTAVMAQYFTPENKSFGYLMEAEVKSANKVLHNPEKPLTAIVGGAKVSDKILLLDRLLDTVDNLIIGGGMAYTFAKAQGGQIGNSICEHDKTDLALELLAKGKAKGVHIYLPTDNKIANKFANDAESKFVATGAIPDGWEGLDIGPESIKQFGEVILRSKTILWNGPMGVFEFENFAQGTRAIAEYVAKATQQGAYSLIGGGDSVAAVIQMGLVDQVSHASTGGGAMLEYLEGKVLPGIAAMEA
ncbi:MAG: phosphoglycerate kinase [Bacteroidetes bacterium]|nr:MAG: phosphoglycerate kinase [Bacteroidota bacterium]PTM11859.1 MAG: phosphoglycerate kinase [Bacteroidota bacterium]